MDPHFNIFHHYGDKAHYEDNLTRALWIALARSVHSHELTKRFLHFVGESPGLGSEVKAALQDPDWDSEPTFDFQVRSLEYFENPDIQCILLGIAPEQTQVTDVVEDEGDSRPDASIVTNRCALLFENKIWGELDADQMRRHTSKFGEGASVSTIQLTWPAVIDFFLRLPRHLKNSFVASEFLAFVTEFPHLVPDFTLFTPDDLMKPDWRTATRLAKLSGKLVSKNPRIKDTFRLTGGMDWDCYTVDQPELVGNIGYACWGDGKFSTKIAIGNTQIQTPKLFDRDARYSGRYGMDRLLEVYKDQKGFDFSALTDSRIFFHPVVRLKRGNKDWWYSVEPTFTTDDLIRDQSKLFELLKSIHPTGTGQNVSDEILGLIKASWPDFDKMAHQLKPGQSSRSGFYQYAALLITNTIEHSSLKDHSVDSFVTWTSNSLSTLHEMLRMFSGLSKG